MSGMLMLEAIPRLLADATCSPQHPPGTGTKPCAQLVSLPATTAGR